MRRRWRWLSRSGGSTSPPGSVAEQWQHRISWPESMNRGLCASIQDLSSGVALQRGIGTGAVCVSLHCNLTHTPTKDPSYFVTLFKVENLYCGLGSPAFLCSNASRPAHLSTTAPRPPGLPSHSTLHPWQVLQIKASLDPPHARPQPLTLTVPAHIWLTGVQ